MKIVLYILSVSTLVVCSQLILKKAMQDFSGAVFDLNFILKAFMSPLVQIALIMQVASFCLWLYVISKENLGIAFGISGGFFYLLLPLFTWAIFGEKLLLTQWIGLIFIAFGVVLVATKIAV